MASQSLVVVEGAAGAGKTTMLGAAIHVAAEQDRASRVVAPTLRAAQVAQEELGVPATSVLPPWCTPTAGDGTLMAYGRA